MNDKAISRRRFILDVSMLAITPTLPVRGSAYEHGVERVLMPSNEKYSILVSTIGFNGMHTDNLLHIQHLGNGYRAYSPVLFKFHAMDSESPFGSGGENPYSYVNCNPTNLIDPSGHTPSLVYGLWSPRNDFMKKRGIEIDSATGAIMDVFAATQGDRNWIDDDKDWAYPTNQPYFDNYLKSHPKYKNIFNSSVCTLNVDDLDDMRVVYRKCKAGLSWATSSGMKVDFVLDEINMQQVVYKTTASTTSSELRWVFRNRHSKAVKESVTFWSGDKIVSPPWKGEGKEMWSKYIPRSSL